MTSRRICAFHWINCVRRVRRRACAGVAADGSLWVALYSDATAKLPGAEVAISGGYPYADGPVVVAITREKAGKVRFRIPKWSAKFTLNGAAGVPRAWELTLSRGIEERTFAVSDYASLSNIADPNNWFSLWF